MPPGTHVAFLIVAVICFLLGLLPPLRTYAVYVQDIGLAFFAAAFLVG